MTAIQSLSVTTQRRVLLAGFYRDALGFEILGDSRREAREVAATLGVTGGATVTAVRLGDQFVELVEFDAPGRAYPEDALATDALFQHFAIVVADMRAAYTRLARAPGWRSITLRGPQSLPASSGGVTAFKFRDPEGHPLELLAFPAVRAPAPWRNVASGDVCLGIDHTAIDVTDTERSRSFYEALGFSVTGGSLNQGGPQQRLDGAPDALVQVTAMAASDAPPHLELLCYRRPAMRAWVIDNNDVAATRIVIEAESEGFRVDPDGHRLTLAPRAPGRLTSAQSPSIPGAAPC